MDYLWTFANPKIPDFSMGIKFFCSMLCNGINLYLHKERTAYQACFILNIVN